MDVLALTPVEEDLRRHEWLGRLSMACAVSERYIGEGAETAACENLRRTLGEFLRSGVPSAELRSMLREEMR